MASLIVVGVLKTTNHNARQQVIEQFERIVEYSGTEEPGVVRYAITVPRDSQDTTTVYAIEEYTTQQASDDHLASAPVQGLIALFGDEPSVLAEPPKVYQLEYTAPSHHFTRAQVATVADPFIVFALAQQSDEAATAGLITTWSKVVAKAQADEPSTLLYALVRDKEHPKQIGTIEAYTDQAAFEAHCQTSEVGALISRNKEISGEMDYVVLRMLTGWLSR